jgi:tetratricopeptide (TPR) repeat protein
LRQQGKLPEAEAACRKAIGLNSEYAEAHVNLGAALQAQGKLPEAVEAYRKAIKLKPDYALAHSNLGLVLMQQGQFAEALAKLRRGHELGSRDPRWPHPSALWVRLAEVAPKLPQILDGKAKPTNANECLDLAVLCRAHKRFYAAAARIYGEAFGGQPGLADDVQCRHRYDGACSAALAGCGQGKDAEALGDEDRARLRQQAQTWLRADLEAWGRILGKDPDKARPLVGQTMRHWQADADFAGVRGEEALARLPEAERREWQKLWQETEGLRKRAASPP